MFYSLICITKLNYLLGMQSNIKKFLHFFSSSVRMGGKSIIFNDKKTKKKKKKIIKAKGYLIQMTQMLIKYQFPKNNLMVEKAYLNTLLDIVIMMTLDHYV